MATDNNKLKMQTKDKADENFEKLSEMFPNAVTETINEKGEIVRAIDKDVLAQEISATVVDRQDERYQFTWPAKNKSIIFANEPIEKTLRPCREESVDFDNTENLYIEGDNLDVLKLLQETYLGKVKMIYIDPPYNTGHDFIYEDDFSIDSNHYKENSGQVDDEGNRLVQNLESNGRFHTDWLNMMYPRLKLARDLLTDDGVIFISIDDNEQANLKKICDEIFGECNCVTNFVWINNLKGRQIQKCGAAGTHEYIFCYAKNKQNISEFIASQSYLKNLMPSVYKGFNYEVKEDDRGKYVVTNELYNSNQMFNEETRPNLVFNIFYNPRTKDVKVADIFDDREYSEYVKINPHQNNDGIHKYHAYRWSKDKVLSESYNLEFVKNNEGFKIYTKRREFDKTVVKDVIENITSTDGATDLKNVEMKEFSYPKPVKLLKFLLKSATNPGDIILDFFSGSATTAHAVMQLNAEDSLASQERERERLFLPRAA